MTTQLSSHGRGGAGNMADAKSSPKISPSDLETPTLKKPVVTTGRGGNGNMAKNDDPAETRKWQDVHPVPRRYSSGNQHAGRGGAGNVFKEDTASQAGKESGEQAVEDGDAPASAKTKKGWIFGKKP